MLKNTVNVEKMENNTFGKKDKVLEKLKKHQKQFIIFGIILLLCIIICSPMLQFHIASDTYNLMDLGYFEYPSQYFLKDARVVSTLVMYIAGFLHLPFEIFIVLMEILAVIIASFSIYYIYKTVDEKLKLNNTLKTALVIMAGFILIFNCMSLEYLLYAECSVMCLSVFLSIMAARTFTSNDRYKNIKSIILVIIATFCYQGAVNIFLPLTILFLFIDKNKKTIKEIIRQILLSCVIIVISYLINVLSIYIINALLRGAQTRIAGGVFNNLQNAGLLLSYVLNRTLLTYFNLWPKGIILIFIAISIVLILASKNKGKNILIYFIILIFALGICIVPVFFMSSPSMEPRMAMSVGAIIGMSFIYLLSIEYEKKVFEYIISTVIVVFFVFNAVNTIQIYLTHIAGNKIDANMGMTIKYRIEEYEKESGNTVNKVAYYRDANHRDYHYGWNKKFSSFGQRAFDNYYCIIEALNYYCGRDFERANMTEKIYNTYFAGKDWNAYSDEQIVFEGDTMYICTY